jgi:DNA-binding response OmpR family regulator
VLYACVRDEHVKRLAALVVEDDEDVKKILTAILKKHASVDVAVDGEEALDRLKDSAYDVVVLDLMLPKVNGLEVARMIGSLEPRPKLIVFSALSRYFADRFPAGTVVLQKPQGINELEEIFTSMASAG